MSYIDHVIEHGTNFRVDRRAGSAMFRPVDDSAMALERFQHLVHDLRQRQGDGYAIGQTHQLGAEAEALVDGILVTITGGRSQPVTTASPKIGPQESMRASR